MPMFINDQHSMIHDEFFFPPCSRLDWCNHGNRYSLLFPQGSFFSTKHFAKFPKKALLCVLQVKSFYYFLIDYGNQNDWLYGNSGYSNCKAFCSLDQDNQVEQYEKWPFISLWKPPQGPSLLFLNNEGGNQKGWMNEWT